MGGIARSRRVTPQRSRQERSRPSVGRARVGATLDGKTGVIDSAAKAIPSVSHLKALQRHTHVPLRGGIKKDRARGLVDSTHERFQYTPMSVVFVYSVRRTSCECMSMPPMTSQSNFPPEPSPSCARRDQEPQPVGLLAASAA